jgi:hypothetical protein
VNTPAHVVFNALVLGRGRWRQAWLPITAGALMPDLPMVGFYIYQRVVMAVPENFIWSDAYFQPTWQLFFDLFNSLPILGLAALVCWHTRSIRSLAFVSSMILHCLTDLPLHHDDAHAHFLPISGWRFESPVSYWDPQHYGRLFGAVELLLVFAAGSRLMLRRGPPAWKLVGAVVLACYAAFIAFAVLVWL